jgi:hypothetical protein
MKVIKFITIFCMLFQCYACTRTLIRSEENDLNEPILAGKAHTVTDRNGNTYDLNSPNIYSVSDDTLHFTPKKTGRVVSAPQDVSIALTDIKEISVNNPIGTIALIIIVPLGIFVIYVESVGLF